MGALPARILIEKPFGPGGSQATLLPPSSLILRGARAVGRAKSTTEAATVASSNLPKGGTQTTNRSAPGSDSHCDEAEDDRIDNRVTPCARMTRSSVAPRQLMRPSWRPPWLTDHDVKLPGS